jgi:hypothetical protein
MAEMLESTIAEIATAEKINETACYGSPCWHGH